MKIAIVGAGGVGGYFGARLIQGGSDVHFIARGAHLAAMRAHGLQVYSPLGDAHLNPVQATDQPAEVGPVDVVFLTVKLTGTALAMQQIKPLFGPHTAIVSFQNGVQKDEPLRQAFGAEAVFSGTTYISAVIEQPGVIRHASPMARLIFGETNGQRSARTQALLAACERAGIEAIDSDDIVGEMWKKYCFLVALSGATTSMRQPIGPIRSNPLTRQFLHDLLREATAVARASGVPLGDEYVRSRIDYMDRSNPTLTSSQYHDLERGKPLEIMWLSGGVAAMGEALGVPTPANRAVRDILALHADGAPAAPEAA